jgi:hypothetical protein
MTVLEVGNAKLMHHDGLDNVKSMTLRLLGIAITHDSV